MNDDYITDYEYGDLFYEDISYVSEDSPQRPLAEDNQSVFEVKRVLEDKDTGEILYYMQSTKGSETKLMTADEIEDMEAYNYEGDSE